MNKLLKKGVSAWLIFIKNKLAGAVMMFLSGLMMAIAGFNGNGNDTKSIPSMIILFGFVLSLWAFYRIGYIKSKYDTLEKREEKALERKVLIVQIFEAVLYVVVALVGAFFYANSSFTNKILDLMCGGFTILNGVFGCIYVYKNREKKNFGWKFRIGLTVLEFCMGIYFIFASDSIDASGYAIMGSITTVAGIIEIAHTITRKNIEDAVNDSKQIVKVLKDKNEAPEEEIDDEE
jgi:uncharacterized membrane protein HdeD (DUF308 family)